MLGCCGNSVLRNPDLGWEFDFDFVGDSLLCFLGDEDPCPDDFRGDSLPRLGGEDEEWVSGVKSSCVMLYFIGWTRRTIFCPGWMLISESS